MNTHAYISSTQEVNARSEMQLSLTFSGPVWAKGARRCLNQKTRSKETNKENLNKQTNKQTNKRPPW